MIESLVLQGLNWMERYSEQESHYRSQGSLLTKKTERNFQQQLCQFGGVISLYLPSFSEIRKIQKIESIFNPYDLTLMKFFSIFEVVVKNGIRIRKENCQGENTFGFPSESEINSMEKEAISFVT